MFATLQAHLGERHSSHTSKPATGAWPSALARFPCKFLAPGAARDYNATFLLRPEWTPVEVPARRLDDCLDDWSVERFDLMKIDVEGAEPRVLAAAPFIWRKARFGTQRSKSTARGWSRLAAAPRPRSTSSRRSVSAGSPLPRAGDARGADDVDLHLACTDGPPLR